MTTRNAIRAELADLGHVIAAFESAGLAEWSPEWVALQGLLRRQADLLHQADLVEGKAEVEITLVGGAERDSTIGADFLGDFVSRVQATFGSLVQTIMYGEETARGRLQAQVLESAALRVAPAAAGSFKLLLDGPRRVAALTVDGEEQAPPFDEALDRIVGVLHAAEADGDPEALRAAIADLGSHRAVGDMRELSAALARSGTTATLVQRSPFAEGPKEVRVPQLAAGRLLDALSKTEQTTTTVVETGRLSGVRWGKAIFDLEVTREPEGRPSYVEVLSGRVISDIRPAVDSLFDKVVRATLERTITKTEADQQEQVRHRLVDVDAVHG